MSPSRRRPRSLVTLAVGLAVLATGCNASATKETESGRPSRSFVLITPDAVGTNDFLKLSVKGIEAAGIEHGGSTKVLQSNDPTTITQNVTAAAQQKPDVIVAVGFEFNDALAQAAERNPRQQFVLVDSCTPKQYRNITCAVFREQEGVFLAGAEAGLLTKSDKVGAVAALDTPQFHRFSDPFGEGAKKVNPAITFTDLYVGGQNPFSDPARAKEQASALSARGVDVVMGAAAAGNTGIFDAGKGGKFTAWGVDTNQCPSAPDVVVDNVVKRTDVVIRTTIGDVLNGKVGVTKSFGLAEDGVALTGLLDDVAGSQCLIAKSPAVITKVKQLRQQIVTGTLKIDDPAAK
jgi:basic membrane protein A and related proteins